MTISRRTLATLAQVIAEQFGHASMDGLVFEYGFEGNDPPGSLIKRAVEFVRNLEAQRDEAGQLEAIREIVPRLRLIPQNTLHSRLIQALEIDNLVLSNGELIPTTPAPAAMGEQISLLERELANNGLNTAGAHYRQAVENFVNGNWEASNGQTRSFMEDLVITRNASITGQQRTDPLAALQDLRQAAYIDDAEWNQVRGFWAGIQDNGPHRGLSNDQEALFRLHCSTSFARYLLSKDPQ